MTAGECMNSRLCMRRIGAAALGALIRDQPLAFARTESTRRSFATGAQRVGIHGGYVFGVAVAMGGAGVACAESNKSEGKGMFATVADWFGMGTKRKPAIVVCGPSGVGKGTIINAVMKTRPEMFGFSVSHATRKPRPGEEDGVHYNFTTVPEIEAAISRGEFIEYANVHGNYYGTSKAAVSKVAEQGKVCILDIDVQGATSVKKSGLAAKYIFILPPSMEELEKRLRGRGTDKEEAIVKRLANAAGEIAKTEEKGFFDLVITNDNLDAAVARFLKFVDEEVKS